jgi:heat shock protein HtpX
MSWFRRVAFFIGLNIIVITTISLVMHFLGIGNYVTAQGIDFKNLIIICLLWGMGGAFISLLLSKVMAKWMMGVKIIDPNTRDPQARELVEAVHRMARQAGLRKMPEVGYYDSPEVNAFATGPSKNNSLVAVSSGLLNSMDRRAVEGVLGHEVAHIANGDMVTMTLIQGVVNAFVMALARIIAFAIDNFLKGRSEDGQGLGHLGHMLVVIVLQTLLFIPGSIIVAYFSRQREYRADAGGARLSTRDNMVAALRSLQRMQEANYGVEQPDSAAAIASLKISPTKRSKFASLFSTHPDLEDRIARLERGM